LCFNCTKTVRLRCRHVEFSAVTSLGCCSSKSEAIERGLPTAVETAVPLLCQLHKDLFCESAQSFLAGLGPRHAAPLPSAQARSVARACRGCSVTDRVPGSVSWRGGCCVSPQPWDSHLPMLRERCVTDQNGLRRAVGSPCLGTEEANTF